MEEILRQRAYAPDISFIKLFMESVDHLILFPTCTPIVAKDGRFFFKLLALSSVVRKSTSRLCFVLIDNWIKGDLFYGCMHVLFLPTQEDRVIYVGESNMVNYILL